ncbi:DUF4132 domain-containing protein [Iodobacter sp. HSC-16F04]|uniref:DUF4132 domain-containing protein n=1 Tax=Iodobacter violaceini TaxID=3044271 RepID=A0ABX0KRT6_9NEIS|nr:DUF4132 domain-containing protein [Iodobacter violacea]NHQ84747.1 DUF4132 domain-containing protein [Iodobacter violacea]
MKRFEYTEGQSSKFWEVEQDGLNLNICWGRIGSKGQTQTKEFASADKASAAQTKLIQEKISKGYSEVSSSETSSPIKNQPAAKAIEDVIITSAPLQQEQGAVPPWLEGELIALTSEMSKQAYPNRQHPGEPHSLNADASWQQFADSLKEKDTPRSKNIYQISETGTPFAAACNEALMRLNTGKRTGSFESDAVIFALACSTGGYYGTAGDSIAFTHYLLSGHGLAYAIKVLVEAEKINVHSDWDYQSRINTYTLSHEVEGCLSNSYSSFCDAELLFRTALAQADESSWQAAADYLQAMAPDLSPARRMLVALLLPERPDFANALALELAQTDVDLAMLATVVTSPEARKAVIKGTKSDWLACYAVFPSTVIRQHGIAAAELLERFIMHEATADMIARIGTPEALSALARVASQSKSNQVRFIDACKRWPLAAIATLTDLLASSSKENGLLAATLSMLIQSNPAALERVWSWLSSPALAVVNEQLARFAQPSETASEEELPGVLVNPPWLQKKKASVAALELDVLPLAPVEQWAAGEKEKILEQPKWYVERFNNARKNTETLAEELGFSRPGRGSNEQQIFAGIKQQAVSALTQNDAQALIQAWKNYKASRISWWCRTDSRYLTLLPEAMALQVWPVFAADDGYSAQFTMASFGLKGLDGLLVCVQQRPATEIGLALNFGWAALAPIIARAYLKLKTARNLAREWLLKYPEHAITGLLPAALGKSGEARDCASVALRLLAAQGHTELIHEVANRYQQAEVLSAVQAMLDEDPLDRFPAKIAKAPAFWQAQSLHRPVLVSNGKALPNSALEHLSTMLRFPSTEGIYPGISQVKAACQPQSLADFAWDGFNQWLFAAAPSKENWAFSALGLLGTDDTARKLTPLIRAWPGESQHARAVAGLDVLATIGSDVALMLLNGIAQKVKFKGLQDKAREKIAAIAEARELSTEELEDRLAPDLGLDEHGTLLLDFGPRQFRVGFDETLKPYVRDMDGARLPDLPKPKKTDDEQLAKDAVNTFKQLKKDVKTIASQQVQRLEIAMCQRRRWPVSVFVQFLATHPLVRHLVQRLVWGVYSTEGDGRFGGTLLGNFRVAEDGSYSTGDDDEFVLPEGEIRIGLPHALEMPAAESALFSQLFADYELLQPFPQLGRESHRFSANEAEQCKLLRWKDRVVATGKILGLTSRGWRRGDAQDAGGIWYYTKDIGQGRLLELTFDPGMIVGMLDEYPEQKLQELTICKEGGHWQRDNRENFATLDPITASELIRDMEALVS